MKKLILSLMILLGGIAGTQAQTFSFSCIADGDIVEDSSSFTTTPTLDGFDSVQMDSLDDALFEERASNGGAPYFGINVQPTPQIGRYEIRIQNFDGGIFVGARNARFDYQLTNHINRGSRIHSNDGADLIALAIAAAGRDTDGDGYTDHENYVLWNLNFEIETTDSGIRFQYFVNTGQTTDSSEGYYAYLEIIGTTYDIYDDDDSISAQRSTFQDAIDYILNL